MCELGYVNFNHGSFGSTPNSVVQTQRDYSSRMESMPDFWFRPGTGYREIMTEMSTLMAKLVNASDPLDVTLVENASAGVNAVFRSLKFKAGDKILFTSTAYPMVKNLIKYLVERDGIIPVEVPVVFPLTSYDEILAPVARMVAEHGSTIKLASFSHIDSVPGFILPVNELIKICRGAGIRTLIDGAHAIGQISINLREMDPDFYVTNAHKWLFAPKGTAIFYVRKDSQAEISPNVVGSEWAHGNFASNFVYTGTRDYTSFLCLESALAFRARIGGEEAIRTYIHNLAWWAGSHLSALWGTTTIFPEFMVGSMVRKEIRRKKKKKKVRNNSFTSG